MENKTNVSKTNQNDLQIILFGRPKEWEDWLEQNHADTKGIWLRLSKKNSGISSVTYSEALEVALCYGWIDGQAKKYDEHSYLQKFTPRRPQSIWSKRNIEHIKRLIKEGKMKLSGLKEAEKAKADGRWERAYDSPGNMVLPEDFLRELSKSKKAEAFFESLSKTNKYSIAWRLQTAKKPETREKRMKAMLEMLERGEKFHA